MPYIDKNERNKYEKALSDLYDIFSSLKEDKLEGELNYFISSLIDVIYNPSYYSYNKAIGLLECVKQEYYRRVVSVYEDKKKDNNGDVY